MPPIGNLCFFITTFLKISHVVEGGCLPKEWEGQYWLSHDHETESDVMLQLQSSEVVTKMAGEVNGTLNFKIFCCNTCASNVWPKNWEAEPWKYAQTHIRSTFRGQTDCFRMQVYRQVMLLFPESSKPNMLKDCSAAQFAGSPLILIKKSEACLPKAWEGRYWLTYDEEAQSDVVLDLRNDVISTHVLKTKERYGGLTFSVLCCMLCQDNKWLKSWVEQPWEFSFVHHRTTKVPGKFDCFKIQVVGNVMVLYEGSAVMLSSASFRTCDNVNYKRPKVLIKYPPVPSLTNCGLPPNGAYHLMISTPEAILCRHAVGSHVVVNGPHLEMKSCSKNLSTYKMPVKDLVLSCAAQGLKGSMFGYRDSSPVAMMYTLELEAGRLYPYCVASRYNELDNSYDISLDVTDALHLSCDPMQPTSLSTAPLRRNKKYIFFKLSVYSSCEAADCKHRGRCRDESDPNLKRGPCSCPAGTTGIFCETDISACKSNPCANHGQCRELWHSFECVCSQPFGGPTCQIFDGFEEDSDEIRKRNSPADQDSRKDPANSCESDPCVMGVCVDLSIGYYCHCRNGYVGEHCEITVLPCDSSPCMNEAICRNNGESYRCVCKPGYYGIKCENQVSSEVCNQNPCLNNGTCVPTESGFMCSCPPGLGGWYCEVHNMGCSPNPCSNGGSCIVETHDDGSTTIWCRCTDDFEGPVCNLPTAAGSRGYEKRIRHLGPNPEEEMKTNNSVYIFAGAVSGVLLVLIGLFHFVKYYKKSNSFAKFRFLKKREKPLEVKNEIYKHVEEDDEDYDAAVLHHLESEATLYDIGIDRRSHQPTAPSGAPETDVGCFQMIRKRDVEETGVSVTDKKKPKLYTIVKSQNQQANALLHRDRAQDQRLVEGSE